MKQYKLYVKDFADGWFPDYGGGLEGVMTAARRWIEEGHAIKIVFLPSLP